MLNKLLQVAKLAALLAVIAYCYVASTFYIRVGAALQAVQGSLTQFDGQSSSIAANTNDVLRGAAATMDVINRPCGGGKPCGTLADVAKTLGTVRGAAGQIEVAANHEDKRIGVLDAQEATIFTNTNASLLQFHADLLTANTTIASVQPVLSGLERDAQALQVTTESVSALVGNEDLRATLKNTSHASASLAAIADDTRQAVHAYFHPKWPHKVWTAVTGIGVTALKILW